MQNHNEQSPVRRIIRAGEVRAATTLSRSCIDQLEARGDFPRRLQLGPRAAGWYADEIAAWVESRRTAR
jgi:prophage regulatory protein